MMIGPPTNSASVNCQPSRSARITPSSITRLVLAISKTIAALKLAPLRNSERASATAAYEHDELATPSPVALASVAGRSSPSMRVMVSRRTTAWTIADSVKPRTNDQVICQVIDPAIVKASPRSERTEVISSLPSGHGRCHPDRDEEARYVDPQLRDVAGGRIGGEPSRPLLVEAVEVPCPGQQDPHLDHVPQGRTTGSEDRLAVRQRLPGLVLDGVAGHRAGARVDARRTRD